MHTAVVLGAGLFLADQARAGLLPGPVRLIFQPDEEGSTGAKDVIAAGGLASVGRIFAVHCDPRLDVGKLGIRSGAITAACDHIKVHVRGPGGHTARPHLTADVVYALGKVVTELPAALSRRVDPRSSLSLVWGRMSAGSAANAIPDEGIAEGTVRCLDNEAWEAAPALFGELVQSVASAYGVTVELNYQRNVPATVNEPASAAMFATGAESVLGPDGVMTTPQSLGGEDFAYYLDCVPGALARLGTRPPGGADGDLHQPSFDVDERAIGVGVRVMVATALTALWHGAAAPEPQGPRPAARSPAPPRENVDGRPGRTRQAAAADVPVTVRGRDLVAVGAVRGGQPDRPGRAGPRSRVPGRRVRPAARSPASCTRPRSGRASSPTPAG